MTSWPRPARPRDGIRPGCLSGGDAWDARYRLGVPRPPAAPCLQELARRVIGIAAPDHGHDPDRVEHDPPVLALDADQAVRADLHAGQLLVVGGGEPDLAGLGHHHEDRPGLPDEGLEQLADHLAGHESLPPNIRYKQDAPAADR